MCWVSVLTACLSSSSTIQPMTDVQMRQQLASAIAGHDRARLRQLSVLLLDDVIARRYVYGYESRHFLSEMPGQIDIADLTPKLRTIATMSLSNSQDDDRRMLLDSIAISSALLDLAIIRDPDAKALNMSALGDPRLAASAIGNLEFLQAWEATADVRYIAKTLPVAERHTSLFIAVLRFLIASPAHEASDCVFAQRFRPLYSECGVPESSHSPAGCGELQYIAKQFSVARDCRMDGDSD
jgi:hypothetical protein